MKLLRIHRILLLVVGACLLPYLIGHMLLIRPLHSDIRKLNDDLQRQRFHLNRHSLPLDARRLEHLEAELAVAARLAEQRYREVAARSTNAFTNKILTFYETAQHFQTQASRLDYQEEFLRIEQDLQQHGIILDSKLLNLAEDSVGPEIYKLILRLWSLEAIMQRVLAEGLGVASAPETSAAAITVSEPYSYSLQPGDAHAYLLALPVRLRLQGSVQALHRFLSTAANRNNFIAITHLELRKQLPGASGNAETEADDLIIADLQCCTFYLLSTELASELQSPSKSLLPPGA